MRKPVNGSDSGSCWRKWRSALPIRLEVTPASARTFAMRSTTRSRKLKRYSRRDPREGATKPVPMRRLMDETGIPKIFCAC